MVKFVLKLVSEGDENTNFDGYSCYDLLEKAKLSDE